MAENFDLIFGQNASQQYAWSDSDYQDGWETVGNIPPTAAQFDALQRRNDMKTKELNDNLTPLVNANTAETRQPATAYNEGDMKYSPLLPTGWFLSCVVAGTTSAGEIVLPSPVVENASVVDGTVTWKIRKIGSGGGEAVGVIKAFAGNGDIPSGYLLCDGAAVSRTMFPDLFAAIGTTYGAGDGSTTFNLPNLVGKFAEGAEVAGTAKAAGLPNITGALNLANSLAGNNSISDRLSGTSSEANAFQKITQTTNRAVVSGVSSVSSTLSTAVDFSATRSSSIYGNSDTVQPPALTTRYIIKAFDGQTPDSALIDITQYAQELAHKANITGSNLVHHRDVITTSGTYTAPVTGLYKITVKGGGGGGAGGYTSSDTATGGGGGGEGGLTYAWEHLGAGDTVAVVVGAGGTGGAAGNGNVAGSGGNTTVTANNNTYVGGGGSGAMSGLYAGIGGNGTIPGSPGGSRNSYYLGWSLGGSGGGAGGAICNDTSTSPTTATNGGGGAGGAAAKAGTIRAGGNGGDGYCWFEYYTPGAN